VQEALLATLDDPVKAVRRVAVEVVAQTARTRPRLAQHLRAALGSQQSNRRWAAAFALGQIGSPPSESLPVLLENLGHPDGDIRWSAHKLLVRLAPAEPRVRMEALRLAGGATDHTRKMALYLLRDLGTSDAELHRVVLAALQSPDHNVRLAAVNVLIKLRIDPPALLEQLRQLETADPVAGVRRAARAALGALA
jgi:HEAT repeat protein